MFDSSEEHVRWAAHLLRHYAIEGRTKPATMDPYQVFHNNESHVLGKFTGQYFYWMTWHWRVFRAKGNTANLTITDWSSEGKPSGPIGQELLFNFFEIQPCFGRPAR